MVPAGEGRARRPSLPDVRRFMGLGEHGLGKSPGWPPVARRCSSRPVCWRHLRNGRLGVAADCQAGHPSEFAGQDGICNVAVPLIDAPDAMPPSSASRNLAATAFRDTGQVRRGAEVGGPHTGEPEFAEMRLSMASVA